MTMTNEPYRHSSFLTLPPEIRDEIYRHLFTATNCKFQTESGDLTYRFQFQIFRTSKKIHEEARRIFYAENSFARIETPWSQALNYLTQEGLPTLSLGALEQLHILINSPDIEATTTSKFLIHVNDIYKFCELWFYSNLTYLEMNPHLSLELAFKNPFNPDSPLSRTTQKQFIEPFGMIKCLGKFEASNNIDADILDQVKQEMAKPLDSPTTCIEKSIELLNAGNAMITANKPREALELYRKSFLAIHIVIEGKFERKIYAERYFEALLSRPFFGNQSAGFARIVLRMRLVAAMMLAYLKLQEWYVVYSWGLRSINLYRRSMGEGADEPGHPAFPAPNEWGKVYYRTALAAEELERYEEAKEFYVIAKAWLPADEEVSKTFDDFCLKFG